MANFVLLFQLSIISDKSLSNDQLYVDILRKAGACLCILTHCHMLCVYVAHVCCDWRTACFVPCL